MDDIGASGAGTELKKGQGVAYRILRIFTEVRPGEAVTAGLLTLNVFLLLLAYYILKVVRDTIMLSGHSPELKSYLSAVQAVLFVFVVKGFSALASRVPRQTLISRVSLIFISNIAVFYVLRLSGFSPGILSILYYVWVGIFNLMVVAQFWAFANDLYTDEAGKRLFPLIAFGATAGALFGSKITGLMMKPLGMSKMMLVSGGVLGVCILLTMIVHRREIGRSGGAENKHPEETLKKKLQEQPLQKGGGFRLVFKSRYLLYIALLVLAMNFVNTTGEYVKDTVFTRTWNDAVRAGTTGGLEKEQYIGKLVSDLATLMSFLAMIIQLFLVSRIFKWIGVRGALFVLPLIAFGGYFFVAVLPALLVVRWAKAMDNATEYSLMNTTRQALFLVTSREAKYKAKAAIDTFFVRTGDVLSALAFFVGMNYLSFNVKSFAALNVAVSAAWIVLCLLLSKAYKKTSAVGREIQAE